jgi:hypothetical protein
MKEASLKRLNYGDREAISDCRYGVGSWEENNNTKEPGNRSSTVSGYILPNILLHHCPGVIIDYNRCYFLFSSQWSPATFPTLEVNQRPHLHLITVVASCMHLPSNCHLGSEDTLLVISLPIPWFFEKSPHFLEKPTIMYISLP